MTAGSRPPGPKTDRRGWRWAPGALAVALVCSGAGSAPKPDPAWEKLMAAERQFQQEFFELMAGRWPDLAPALEVSRDLQLALRDLRTLQFYYTLQHHPERIVRDQGVPAFENQFLLRWTEEDAKRLRKQHPQAQGLEQRVGALREANSLHPLWPKVLEKFSLLEGDPAYQGALHRLQAEAIEAQQMLRTQPASAGRPGDRRAKRR